MFRPLLFSVLALTASATAASAQDWNRRVSDVHIVHPPGTPPGTWQVEVSLEVTADDSAPPPVDLGFDVEIQLNGTQIDLQHVDVVQQILQPCNWSICNGGYCSTYLVNNTLVYLGSCHQTYFHSGQSMCGCAIPLDLTSGPYGSYLMSSDSISATVTASPGSLPEIDTSDDSCAILPPDNPIGTPFCFGDGTLSTVCPCSNFGATGHGCANSQDPSGALLEATGWSQIDPLTGTDSVVLHGSHMTASSLAIYLKSSGSNPNGLLFGDGLRCASGQLTRMHTKFNVGGASNFPEPGDPSLSTASGVVPGGGVTAYYQVYYRDPASFCTALTYNISSAVAIDW